MGAVGTQSDLCSLAGGGKTHLAEVIEGMGRGMG